MPVAIRDFEISRIIDLQFFRKSSYPFRTSEGKVNKSNYEKLLALSSSWMTFIFQVI